MKKYTFLILTILFVFGNYYLVSLPLNNMTTGELSDKYSTIITPAGFTFGIWSVIFASLFYLSYRAAVRKFNLPNRILGLYGLSTISCLAWLFAWHYEQLIIAALLLTTVAVSNSFISKWLYFHSRVNPKYTLSSALYSIFSAWTIVAATINITTVLQYEVGFDGLGIASEIWGSLIVWILLIIGIIIDRKSKIVSFLGVFTWATLGIYFNQNPEILSASAIITIGASLTYIAFTKVPYLFPE